MPESGTTAAVLHFNGSKCPLGTIFMTGSITASAASNSPGQYNVESELSHLHIGETTVTPGGIFKLSNTSKEALALSSVETLGVPHWLTASSEWTNLAAGKSVSYASSGSMSIGLHFKLGLSTLDITCAGTGNGISGSVENPGGGAGSAAGTFQLSECALSGSANCTLVLPANSAELTGVAGELGGRPVIELSPREGTVVLKVNLVPTGSKECALGTSFSFTGKLIATSEGNGNFGLSSSQLKLGKTEVLTSGTFALKSAAGEYLRLQP